MAYMYIHMQSSSKKMAKHMKLELDEVPNVTVSKAVQCQVTHLQSSPSVLLVSIVAFRFVPVAGQSILLA